MAKIKQIKVLNYFIIFMHFINSEVKFGWACSKTLTTGTPLEHGYIAIILRQRMHRSLI